MLLQIILFILLVAIDQGTKLLTLNYFSNGAESIQIIDGIIELTFVKNTGAAFGMFSNGTLFLTILVVFIFAFILYVKRRLPKERKYFPLHILIVFILAGAAGNLVDRIRLQYVVDMIHFYWFEFPVFNVADIYVTCSSVLLVFLLLTKYKDIEL